MMQQRGFDAARVNVEFAMGEQSFEFLQDQWVGRNQADFLATRTSRLLHHMLI